MPGYYQPPMAVPPSNPAGYPMVTQAPPIQENLLYTKPEWNYIILYKTNFIW